VSGLSADHYAPGQCPLWVISRHRVTSASCLLYPPKRTSLGHCSMSAMCQKRKSLVLFDHLVGAGEPWARSCDRTLSRGLLQIRTTARLRWLAQGRLCKGCSDWQEQASGKR
jgi:hypothetical protein